MNQLTIYYADINDDPFLLFNVIATFHIYCNTVIPRYTAPGYTAKPAYRHKFILYGIFLLYKAFNSPVVSPFATHFLCTNKTAFNREKWIEYSHQRSINQWWSQSSHNHNMVVGANSRPSTEERWQSCRYRNSYSIYNFCIYRYRFQFYKRSQIQFQMRI